MAQMSKKTAVSQEIIDRKLSKDVYIDGSNYILLRQDAIITPRVYQRLLKEGVREVSIYKEADDSPLLDIKVPPCFEELKTEYILHTNKLTSLFEKTANSHTLDIKETSKICAEMINANTNQYNVFMFLDSLRAVDDYLYTHSVNVATLAVLFGKWLGLSKSELECLTMCGLLHDIGKTKVDAKILNKPQKLTASEFFEVKSHTVRGYEFLKSQDIPKEVKEVAYMHHEKIDGLGYPRGLKLDQISEYSRIISIIDIFDAMSHARVYRKEAYSPFQILKEFQDGVYGKLDLKFLTVFLQNIAYMYVGSTCTLTDGCEGKIVFINPTALYAPIVEVGGKMIDLRLEKNLDITGIVAP